jgi:putative membrane protein
VEQTSHAEVVAYVVERAGDGEAEAWQASVLGAIGAVLVATLWRALGAWGTGSLLWLALPAWAGAALGYLAGAHWPALYRRLAGGDLLQARALARAKVAFLDEEVFATRARTGVLVLLAIREHRAVILADTGINAKVAETEWQAIVDRLTAAVAAGEVESGLVAAIRDCGALIAERCGPQTEHDVNELYDDPRVRPS